MNFEGLEPVPVPASEHLVAMVRAPGLLRKWSLFWQTQKRLRLLREQIPDGRQVERLGSGFLPTVEPVRHSLSRELVCCWQ